MEQKKPELSFYEWLLLDPVLNFVYAHEIPAIGNQISIQPSTTSCWLLTKGSVTIIREDDTRETVNEGYWIHLPPEIHRTQRFTPGSSLLSIRLFRRICGRFPVLVAAQVGEIAHISSFQTV